MRILQVHNSYQRPGGEDRVVELEGALLEAHGHQVIRYTRHNDEVTGMRRLNLARLTIWNDAVRRDLGRVIRDGRPSVAHFHNTFPLVSPAAYYAARAEGVPVVQTLHNYRLTCLSAYLYRNGNVCEDCLGRAVPWLGVLRGCYRGSRAASGAAAAMLGAHRLLGTWTEAVDLYIALTEFSRRKFLEAGLPAARVAVKPHFVHPDPGPGSGRGGYVLFVGRLSPEKGIETLLAAWPLLGGRARLVLVGDGPLAERVTRAGRTAAGVTWVGPRGPREVATLVGEAACLVVPSGWYETFGRVVIEAFAAGTPVVAGALGALAELVDPGRTGLHARPGDPQDLAARLDWALANPAALARMRREARREFEMRYTAAENYRRLMALYERAAGGAGQAAGPTRATGAG